MDSHAQTQQSCCTLDKRPVGGPPIFLFLLIHFFLFRGRTPRGCGVQPKTACLRRLFSVQGPETNEQKSSPKSTTGSHSASLTIHLNGLPTTAQSRTKVLAAPSQADSIQPSLLSASPSPQTARSDVSKRAGWVPVGAPLPLSLARMIWQLPSYLAGPAEGCPRVPS